MNNSLRLAAALVAAIGATTSAAAQGAGKPGGTELTDENIRNVLQMMFSEVNTAKIEILNRAMQLTDVEADVFWPIYQEYEAELEKVGYETVDLIREFVELNESGDANEAHWDHLAKRILKNRERRLELWEKYQKKISRELSAFRAAQFLQVENQIAILIDLNIALEMPLIGMPGAVSPLTKKAPASK